MRGRRRHAIQGAARFFIHLSRHCFHCRARPFQSIAIRQRDRFSGVAGGFRFVSSRRAATSQEVAIQVGTPSLGSTHFITIT